MRYTFLLFLISYTITFSSANNKIDAQQKYQHFYLFKVASVVFFSEFKKNDNIFSEEFKNLYHQLNSIQPIDSNLYNTLLKDFILKTTKLSFHTVKTENFLTKWVIHSPLSSENKMAIEYLLSSKTVKHKLNYRYREPKPGYLSNISEQDLAYGIFRYWSEIEYYYPYKKNSDLEHEWDSLLQNVIIPRIINSKKCTYDYVELVYFISNYLNDCHCSVTFSNSKMIFGNYAPKIICKIIENKVIICESQEFLCPRGWEILKIDSTDINTLRNNISPYFSCSTKDSRDNIVSCNLLRGNRKSMILTIQDSNQNRKNVIITPTWEGRQYVYNYYYPNLTMKKSFLKKEYPPIIVWKKINDSLGYVDLKYLFNSDVGKMFRQLKSCKSIIFDLRCYPNNTMDKIMLHLFTKNPEYIIFSKFVNKRFNKQYSVSQKIFMFRWITILVPKYRGKIILLTNEITNSQGETMTLAFKALKDRCVVIGSNTSGTNGNVTYTQLPFGIQVSYTAVGVFDENLKCYQGVGIPPDIYVKNKVKDIYHSRDAILIEAIEYTY